MNCPQVLKDLNFMEIQSDLKRQLFNADTLKKNDILLTLKQDSLFLQRHGIMDYSLLLVIDEDSSQTLPVNTSILSYSSVMSRNKIGMQHVGIIDYLQIFNFNKKAESCWKTRILGNKSDGLSCAPPGIYQRRFMRFMEEQVFSEEREDY